MARNKESGHEKSINRKAYRLPSCYDGSVNVKLNTEKPLTGNEWSAVCRELAKTILPLAEYPDSESYRFVIIKFLDKYPYLKGKNEKIESFIVIYFPLLNVLFFKLINLIFI